MKTPSSFSQYFFRHFPHLLIFTLMNCLLVAACEKKQQQDYFQAVLTEFSDYMENQREEDLRLIRRSLINLQESQEAQKAETDQILANIITTVNNQNN